MTDELLMLRRLNHSQADRLAKLLAELAAANARERPAFEAGYREGLAEAWIEDGDVEQAWQQYRCQDDTDWKVVSEEDAAKIAAAVLGR